MSRQWDDLPPTSVGRLSIRCRGLTADGPFTGFGTPDGDYSRTCWLPVLGPTAWLLWGTLARHLDGYGSMIYRDVDELTDALGLGRPHRLIKALKRLDRLDLAMGDPDNDPYAWDLVEMTPPVGLHHHSTLSAAARRFHHQAIDNLSEDDQQQLWTHFMETYVDHFRGHPC